ncbi:ATP-binding protein [Pseudonocardia endophytica]|uniref:ATP-binding protein n=1 Tax=Pseudonocardia endophytica TaxID=401976 RepID=UPI0014048FE0|nr:ATP-binding protein [Pseudonocardia endophytica]
MSPVLDVELAAEPASAARSRRALSSWLASLCGLTALCDVGQDLVLAVNEAISNSVEHAYGGGPGTVRLRARVRTVVDAGSGTRGCGRLEVSVEIIDHGCWREPPSDPGFRGRGLMMAEASVDHMGIERTSAGTTVTMHRSLGCPSRQTVSA